MVNQLIEASIHNRSIVLVLAVLLLVGGCYVSAHTEVDVLPDFAPPQVIIQTEAPGLVAQEVEPLVSLPLESALSGTPGVTLVRSLSMHGISTITVIFRYGTDIFHARQLVNERLQIASQRLPPGVAPPVMLPVMPAVGDILKFGLVSTRTSPMQLRTLADWDIRNRLLAVPGVARVLVIGGEVKEYQVLVDPGKLKAYGVSLDQVRAAAAQANVVAPSGYLVGSDRTMPIRGVGRPADIGELADSVVTSRDGTPVLLRHVARVEVGPAFKIGDAVVNGRFAVYVNVTKQPWANTIEVTRAVETALEELKKGLPDDVKVVYTFRQANFIERSVANVLWALSSGGALVVAVLVLFLLNWRTSFISLTAIPLSILAAVLAIKASGGSINTMTLGGLAIAVGEVVDDAIVDVENVYRRLRENRASADPRPAYLVVYQACLEVRASVVYATFIVALVFLPVLTLPGVEGRIFSPLALSYMAAVLASLVVALTVTPALCLYLLAGGRAGADEPVTVRRLREGYGSLLGRVMARPRLIVAASAALFIMSLCLLPFMGQAFLPEFREDSLIIPTIGRAGQSLEATTRMGVAFQEELLEHPDVLAVGQWAGRAELDDMAGGPNFSEFDVLLKEGSSSLEPILSDIREHLAELPGVLFDVGSFISHRMDEVLSGGTRAAIAIKIFGPDLGTLRNLASQVAAVLQSVPGAVDVRPEPQVLVPEVTVRIKRADAARYGLTAADIAAALEVAFNGKVVSQVLENQRLFGLRVWFDETHRHNLDQIASTLIDTPVAVRVPISQVAEVRVVDSPSSIVREHVARRIVVQANTAGRDVVGVVEEARAKIDKEVSLPAGYYIVYAGQYAAQRQAATNLAWMSFVAFVGIVLLLNQGLGSWQATALVGCALPLAAIGGVIAVAATGNVLSVGSLIGFISLFGISTRNSILLVSHVNSLLRSGTCFDDAVFRGCLDRVSPVLMTALTAALGMLPLAVLGGAGRELEQPMATVIVGGLATSTLLTLVFIPAAYLAFMRPRKTGAHPPPLGEPVP